MIFSDFLAATPPNVHHQFKGLSDWSPQQARLTVPEIWIHCAAEQCAGVRRFRPHPERLDLGWESASYVFLHYLCSNCSSTMKRYALLIDVGEDASEPFAVMKLGEEPEFGDPIPARVSSLIGDDRDLFFKGYRCEKQGLGIGAYGYYRRVVDSQWQRLLSEIIAVAKREGAPSETVKRLEGAKAEWLFGKGFDAVKDLVPTSLRVHGENPLTLLYDALSNQLHNSTDEECLTHARAARLVLFELAERIGAALKDTNELKDALGALHKARQRPDGQSGK